MYNTTTWRIKPHAMLEVNRKTLSMLSVVNMEPRDNCAYVCLQWVLSRNAGTGYQEVLEDSQYTASISGQSGKKNIWQYNITSSVCHIWSDGLYLRTFSQSALTNLSLFGSILEVFFLSSFLSSGTGVMISKDWYKEEARRNWKSLVEKQKKRFCKITLQMVL